MTKKTISSLSVDAQTIENMKKAIQILNIKSIFEISEASYRRFALEIMNQKVLSGDNISQLNNTGGK